MRIVVRVVGQELRREDKCVVCESEAFGPFDEVCGTRNDKPLFEAAAAKLGEPSDSSVMTFGASPKEFLSLSEAAVSRVEGRLSCLEVQGEVLNDLSGSRRSYAKRRSLESCEMPCSVTALRQALRRRHEAQLVVVVVRRGKHRLWLVDAGSSSALAAALGDDGDKPARRVVAPALGVANAVLVVYARTRDDLAAVATPRSASEGVSRSDRVELEIAAAAAALPAPPPRDDQDPPLVAENADLRERCVALERESLAREEFADALGLVYEMAAAAANAACAAALAEAADLRRDRDRLDTENARLADQNSDLEDRISSYERRVVSARRIQRSRASLLANGFDLNDDAAEDGDDDDYSGGEDDLSVHSPPRKDDGRPTTASVSPPRRALADRNSALLLLPEYEAACDCAPPSSDAPPKKAHRGVWSLKFPRL